MNKNAALLIVGSLLVIIAVFSYCYFTAPVAAVTYESQNSTRTEINVTLVVELHDYVLNVTPHAPSDSTTITSEVRPILSFGEVNITVIMHNVTIIFYDVEIKIDNATFYAYVYDNHGTIVLDGEITSDGVTLKYLKIEVGVINDE